MSTYLWIAVYVTVGGGPQSIARHSHAPNSVVTEYQTLTQYIAVPTSSLVSEPPIITLPDNTTTAMSCNPISRLRPINVPEKSTTRMVFQIEEQYRCSYQTGLQQDESKKNKSDSVIAGFHNDAEVITLAMTEAGSSPELVMVMTALNLDNFTSRPTAMKTILAREEWKSTKNNTMVGFNYDYGAVTDSVMASCAAPVMVGGSIVAKGSLSPFLWSFIAVSFFSVGLLFLT